MNSSYVLQQSSEGPVYAEFAAESKTAATSNPLEHRGFSPYDFNGGTVAAVAGPDYCVVACDTRLSSGYEILSRNTSKIHSFGTGVLASSGSKNDVDQLRSSMDIYLKVRPSNAYQMILFFSLCMAYLFVSSSSTGLRNQSSKEDVPR